jgi:hypothetical protein
MITISAVRTTNRSSLIHHLCLSDYVFLLFEWISARVSFKKRTQDLFYNYLTVSLKILSLKHKIWDSIIAINSNRNNLRISLSSRSGDSRSLPIAQIT